MDKLLVTVAALLTAGVLSASAQTSPGSTGTSAPTSPNSGAGVQGMPGGKSGPAIRSGDRDNGHQQGGTSQDASKIPGMPGNKSGPAANPPSSK